MYKVKYKIIESEDLAELWRKVGKAMNKWYTRMWNLTGYYVDWKYIYIQKLIRVKYITLAEKEEQVMSVD